MTGVAIESSEVLLSADPATVRAAREDAGLSCREAAKIVGVSTITWQRWEGQSERKTGIPEAAWTVFLLKTGRHPTHLLTKKECHDT